DDLVTGVQTCALPILAPPGAPGAGAALASGGVVVAGGTPPTPLAGLPDAGPDATVPPAGRPAIPPAAPAEGMVPVPAAAPLDWRSEERRVGRAAQRGG